MKDPYLQLDILQQALESDKSKIAFLLGAGCPVSIIVQEEGKDKPLIVDVAGLTKSICKTLKGQNIDKIVSRIDIPTDQDVTIEDILSHVRLLIEVVGKGKIDDFTKKILVKLEKDICTEITNAVNKELPDIETPYHKLSSWIGGIPRNNPIEIFTPNYDLLIESALESKNIPYFDGFIGSKQAFFDLHAIENEVLPPRWAKLWKLHGSINWWNDLKGKGNVFRVTGVPPDNKQMIYPSHLKYDESRLMPYFALQDRLGHFLATGQAVLVTCGYSFVDKHLNAIILQRLLANPRAICFGLLFNDLEKYPDALSCAKNTTNLSLIAKDGAFIGGQQVTWNIDESNEKNHYDYCIKSEKKDGSDESAIKCNIGDFQNFGKFLLNQVGNFHASKDNGNAE